MVESGREDREGGREDVKGRQLVGINGRVTESGISGRKMRDWEEGFYLGLFWSYFSSSNSQLP